MRLAHTENERRLLSFIHDFLERGYPEGVTQKTAVASSHSHVLSAPETGAAPTPGRP